ncbi:MAG: hypothetical protein Q8L16_23965 [Hydrogenophaga sp.]|nr:hypothetical protein [Hydrogenophaga sp.]
MDLTQHFIKTKHPCADGFRWFLRHHKDGSNDQDLLDALVDAGRVNDACWLLDQFGPTNEVLTLDHLGRGHRVRGFVAVAADSVRAGGGISAGAQIDCAMQLGAGWGIETGKSIHAQGAIRSGESLSAFETIRSGAGYGVFAGLNVQVEAWESSARVFASEKPEGMMSG